MNFKSYTTESSAKSAIKAAGLHALKVDYPKIGGRIYPLVHVEIAEDLQEVKSRGFNAKLIKAS